MKRNSVNEENYAQDSATSQPIVSVDNSENTSGMINGHEYVDLGLPSGVKWATCNVGASSPSEYGDYFAWGETTVKSDYLVINSKTWGKKLVDISGNPEYDAARAKWGSSWRLPSKTECEELLKECTWTWTSQGGHDGCKVTGSNGNSIFVPAAGWRDMSPIYYAECYGRFWSSTPDTLRAYFLTFGSDGHCVYSLCRYLGFSVRPVSE